MADKLVMSVAEFKRRYFHGTDHLLRDARGAVPTDDFWEFYLRAATQTISRELDIVLQPTRFEERYPYWPQDFAQYAYVSLSKTPLLKINRMSIRWPTDDTNLIDFPTEWLSYKKGSVLGRVQIVPHQNMLGSLLVVQGSTFLPLLRNRTGMIPDLWYVDYEAGMDEVPADILHAIGMTAAIGPFDVGGDLIAGAGIASKSVSIPGLSQSVSTTSSATNAGFGSRIISYQKTLARMMPQLKAAYGRSAQMVVI